MVEEERYEEELEEIVDNPEVEIDNPEEIDEEVEEAKKHGHLSLEEWEAQGKDPKQYKTPEEFNKTAKAIDQIYSLKKRMDQKEREIQALVAYQERTKQREYERAKQDLEARLTASQDDMDMKAVSHYTKELTRLEDTERNSQAQQSQQLQQSAQQNFIERNQHWFNDRNLDLKERAIEIDNEVKRLYPNASFEELAEVIEKRMQYEHPERVLGQSKARPSISPNQSSINKTAVGEKKHVFRNLSQEHKDTYHVYKRINPKITEADFIQRLKADGEI